MFKSQKQGYCILIEIFFLNITHLSQLNFAVSFLIDQVAACMFCFCFFMCLVNKKIPYVEINCIY